MSEILLITWLGCTGRTEAPTVPDPDPVAIPAAEPREARVVRPADGDRALADARCNDGTPFAYSLRPGPDPLWVVDIAGGFFCNDTRVMCSERGRRLTTTLRAPRLPQAGIFSLDPSDNPTFASAHHVEAHYCSSDFWLGDRLERRPTSGDPDQGWYFSGRRNLEALFASLAREGLDEADPTVRVLILGTSAGGIGVMGNIDVIAAAFPTAVAQDRLKVVLDGSWVPAQPPEAPLMDASRWGTLLPACEAALTARGEDPIRCVYGDVWWPFAEALGIPILVQLSGLDKTSTPVFGVDTPEERSAWIARTRDSLSVVPWVFSGAQAYHLVLTETRWGRGPPGRTPRELVDRFWAGGDPEQIFVGYE